MNPVNELCSLHDYIEEHFENVEFISAEAPTQTWNHEKVVVHFTSNDHQYKYALIDETEEEKAE
jgi:hypothetical protein